MAYVHGIDEGPEVFEDLLNPALFEAEAPTSQSTSSGSSQDIDTHSSDSEGESDLPSLGSLLYRNPTMSTPNLLSHQPMKSQPGRPGRSRDG